VATLEDILIRFRGDSSGFDRAAGRVSKTLSNIGQIGAGIAVGNQVSNMLSSVTDSISSAFIGYNSLIQQTMIGFETMLGSAEAAKSMFSNLEDFASTTPFEMEPLLRTTQQLFAMGTAAEDVIPMLTSIGDAVAALGGGGEMMGRITRAFTQMQAKGKVSAEEMMALAEAGIPAWQYLADYMGTTIPAAMDEASTGVIQGAGAVQAILAGMSNDFGGMMIAQAGTFEGAMSTITDTVRQVVAGALKPLFLELASGSVALAAFLSSDKAAAFATNIGNAATSIFNLLKNSVVPAIMEMVEAAQMAWEVAGGFFTDIAKIIGGLLLTAIIGLAKVFQGMFALVSANQVVMQVLLATLTAMAVLSFLKLASGWLLFAKTFMATSNAILVRFIALQRAMVTFMGMSNMAAGWAAFKAMAVGALTSTNVALIAVAATVALIGFLWMRSRQAAQKRERELREHVEETTSAIQEQWNVIEGAPVPSQINQYSNEISRLTSEIVTLDRASNLYRQTLTALTNRINTGASLSPEQVVVAEEYGWDYDAIEDAAEEYEASATGTFAAVEEATARHAAAWTEYTDSITSDIETLVSDSVAAYQRAALMGGSMANVMQAFGFDEEMTDEVTGVFSGMVDSFIDSLHEYGNVLEATAQEDAYTWDTIVANYLERGQVIRDFANNLNSLNVAGIAPQMLQEIMDMGPEDGAPMAQALVDAIASNVDVTEIINALEAQMTLEDMNLAEVGRNITDDYGAMTVSQLYDPLEGLIPGQATTVANAISTMMDEAISQYEPDGEEDAQAIVDLFVVAMDAYMNAAGATGDVGGSIANMMDTVSATQTLVESSNSLGEQLGEYIIAGLDSAMGNWIPNIEVPHVNVTDAQGPAPSPPGRPHTGTYVPPAFSGDRSAGASVYIENQNINNGVDVTTANQEIALSNSGTGG